MKNSPTRPYRSFAYLYDELLGRTAFSNWQERFERLCERFDFSYRRAADIACGTGLAVEYLAERCEKVYGVDLSPEMLSVARNNSVHDNVSFLEQSFLELELPAQVDLILCNFDSLNYLLRESELRKAIERFGENLANGGTVFFDMNTDRELETTTDGSAWVHKVGGSYSVWQSEWEPDSRVHTLRMLNFIDAGDGRYLLKEEVHRERCYDTDLVLEYLHGAGFKKAVSLDANNLLPVDRTTRKVQFIGWK